MCISPQVWAENMGLFTNCMDVKWFNLEFWLFCWGRKSFVKVWITNCAFWRKLVSNCLFYKYGPTLITHTCKNTIHKQANQHACVLYRERLLWYDHMYRNMILIFRMRYTKKFKHKCFCFLFKQLASETWGLLVTGLQLTTMIDIN